MCATGNDDVTGDNAPSAQEKALVERIVEESKTDEKFKDEMRALAAEAKANAPCDCPRDGFGTQTHPADCPTVAWIKETQKRLQPELEEMARRRRRAAAEAANYVIG